MSDAIVVHKAYKQYNKRGQSLWIRMFWSQIQGNCADEKLKSEMGIRYG